ncbi:MAG: hypothetical protein ACRD3B_11760 [Candidatus Sulfotelmatobacter sp.]
MLKTLDLLIGATTVLLLFSMAVTVITQAITNLAGRRGRHLRTGLSDLLQQLGVSSADCAQKIADSVLKHPMIREGKNKLGTVIHREEFTKLLLDLASGRGAHKLEADAETELKKVLAKGGIPDAGEALKNVRALALQIEASNPELSNQMRDGLAILHEAPSDFVAGVNSWFDNTIDRVSQRFTGYTHWITLFVSLAVVVVVQLDIIAVCDRLWIDDQFRTTIVSDATKQFSQSNEDKKVDPRPYYDLLSDTGLITLPVDRNWLERIKDIRKTPGMLLSVLLLSLGAPFWYNALKDLLKLRSTLASKDDAQRARREAIPTDDNKAPPPALPSPPAWLSGERGDLGAVG